MKGIDCGKGYLVVRWLYRDEAPSAIIRGIYESMNAPLQQSLCFASFGCVVRFLLLFGELLSTVLFLRLGDLDEEPARCARSVSRLRMSIERP